ncbi:MAG TPA: hypothetical protein VG797_00710 [Phycisphaerales bacterium]|nr:hypothetical protein [Phycisphaerales bacterium]
MLRHLTAVFARLAPAVAALPAGLAVLLGTGETHAAIPENRVLLVYNSQNAESLAVRDLYVAAHPTVIQFDLNDADLASRAAPGYGGITRAIYVNQIRNPIVNFINGVTPPGPDRSQTIIAIATTRGLPARIDGGFDEFNFNSTFSSVESELSLLQQDMEANGSGSLTRRYYAQVRNPYYLSLNQAITTFSRANIKTQRTFTRVTFTPEIETWTVTGLTAGDLYLVCRLDAAPSPGHTALENIDSLITRSRTLVVGRCAVQSFFDRWSCAALDDDGLGGTYPSRQDYTNARNALNTAGFIAALDTTFVFFSGVNLPDQLRPVLALGSYGENHSLNGCGDNPAGNGDYIQTYNFNPAASFIAFESWSGNSLVDGTQRGGQQQALDFISQGGSFTIGSVSEPFTIFIPRLEFLAQNLYLNNLSFAEAAYTSIPGLSWQQTPIGDPLAQIIVVNQGLTDLNADGVTDVRDVYQLSETPGDVTCDSAFTGADTEFMRTRARANEAADVAVAGP